MGKRRGILVAAFAVAVVVSSTVTALPAVARVPADGPPTAPPPFAPVSVSGPCTYSRGSTAPGSEPYKAIAVRFGHGSDGNVWVTIMNGISGTGGSGDLSLGPLPAGVVEDSVDIAAGTNAQGNLEVFVVGTDGQVYHDYGLSGGIGSWGGWSTLGAPASAIVGDVARGVNSPGNQELFVRSEDGNVYHRFATPGAGSGWSGWDSLGQPAAGSAGDVFVGRNSLNNQELFLIGNDGVLYHDFATPGRGSGWNGWDPMSPLPNSVDFESDVAVGINYVGNQEVYVIGADGNLYHDYATPGVGSGWSGFSSLGAPAGQTLVPFVEVDPVDFDVMNAQFLTLRTVDGNKFEIGQTPGQGTGWSPWTTNITFPNWKYASLVC